VRGPKTALDSIREIKGVETLKNYYLLYAVLGEFQLELRRDSEAEGNFRQALRLTSVPAEKNFLNKKLCALSEAD
jgi:RNA polymerase sigma-70 factor (ECF subfamily)